MDRNIYLRAPLPIDQQERSVLIGFMECLDAEEAHNVALGYSVPMATLKMFRVGANMEQVNRAFLALSIQLRILN